ncbi:alpha/beta fold hydrolase [Nocardia sp. CC227C]|uniref:alpha/beta fold hydrolase n=1 Tax=Nocardia sp. CC227C TaxID=3044562 RepID=UPI00278BAF9C|nr:alpha/beta hydrolase [Nocardia sp. CC227C]
MLLLEPERLGTTTLPDGRRLGWSEWGPADGVPVLFCAGAGWGRRLGFGTEELARLGIRLIGLDRPGIGGSSPAPDHTLLDWAEDVRALDLSGCAVVGFSQGAPFAFACAAAGLATAVAIVSGGDELAHPAFTDALPEQVRDLVDLAANDPAAAAAAVAAFADPDTMLRLSVEMSPPVDRAVYGSPEFDSAFRGALTDGFAQGPGGYVHDTVAHLSPWPFDVSAIDVPVDLWYGELDANPTHSPDHGATLAARLPLARRHLVPDSGGALLWTHAGPILETLLTRR